MHSACLHQPHCPGHVQVLLRALRDFNLGKLTADDTSIFTGLLNDLFPKTAELVPRHIDHDFESKARASSTIAASSHCHVPWGVTLPCSLMAPWTELSARIYR